MRTSAPAAEGRLTIAVLLVALTLVIFFLGGPRQFMLIIQDGTQSLIDLVVATYKSVRT